jgi:hypothetical protein
MEKINDGGPAFPVPMVPWQDGFVNVECTGASLRDWLATHASENDIRRHQRIIERSNGYTYKPSIEECKYAYASEMLKARSANV